MKDRIIIRSFAWLLALMLSISTIQPLQADADVVAVAAGIAPCVEEVMQAFIDQGGEQLQMVKGACGPLARQMAAGAPYDLLLASEPRWPNWLKEKGVLPNLIVFAIGQLTLWHDKAAPPELAILKGSLVAVPEPETTAYGMLAKEYLIREGLWRDALEGKRIIFLGSAPQAVLAVRHGAAAAAFIPHSMAIKAKGSCLIIPGAVIDQVGGLPLKAGKSAGDFWSFCRSRKAEPIWRRWGFKPVQVE